MACVDYVYMRIHGGMMGMGNGVMVYRSGDSMSHNVDIHRICIYNLDRDYSVDHSSMVLGCTLELVVEVVLIELQ